MIGIRLVGFDLNLFVLDIESQTVVDAHVLVGDPDQGKSADQVAAPVIEQQGEAGDDEKCRGHVVAEAVLAGEEIEQLAREQPAAGLASRDAPVPRLAACFSFWCVAGGRKQFQPG